MPYSLQSYILQPTAKTTWCFLKLVSDDGYTGWGEFTIKAPLAEMRAEFQELAGAVEPGDFELDGPKRGPGMLDQPLRSALYTALDQAVFDIHARRRNIPVVELLDPGCRNDQVALYANINRSVVDRSPGGFAERAQQAQAAGFSAIKMAPFDGLTPEICQTDAGRALVRAGAERIQAVRDALDPHMAVMVDCHWRFDEKTANEALDFLKSSQVSWYECPLPESGDTIDALKKLRKKANDLGMRLAGCEKFTGWKDFRPFVEQKVYDVIMPDAKYAGGMREIMDIGARGKAHGVAVSLHNPSGPISHAVSLHIAIALDNGAPLEFQFNETPLFDGIVRGTLPPRTGSSRLPDGPGIGIGLLEDKLRNLLAE